jgi:diguanylate cyclase (GGDEF)-like protein
VDYFKRYNDAHGHLAGDDCLRAIARALRGVCRRPGDLAARYGGEEFVALLPGVDANRAAALGLAVRDAVANIAVPHADSPLGPHVTVSVGVATLSPTRDGDPTALLRAADAALYCAKSEGRNRVAKAP